MERERKRKRKGNTNQKVVYTFEMSLEAVLEALES